MYVSISGEESWRDSIPECCPMAVVSSDWSLFEAPFLRPSRWSDWSPHPHPTSRTLIDGLLSVNRPAASTWSSRAWQACGNSAVDWNVVSTYQICLFRETYLPISQVHPHSLRW